MRKQRCAASMDLAQNATRLFGDRGEILVRCEIYGGVYNVTISWNFAKDRLLALHLAREADMKENISF
jgi:hypothetical protein